MNSSLLIAQISDFHVTREGELLSGRIDTGACLARAVSRLNALDPRPDLVLATGDLVNAGRVEEYRRLKRLLAPLAMPIYLIPGNHDLRAPLREVFNEHRYLHDNGEFIQYEVRGMPVRLIALDTVDEGNDRGLLDEPRIGWIEARLEAAPETPTIVFMHHPPFATGIKHMDRMNCAGGEKLEAIVRRHPQVERVLCGHVHRPVQMRWAGTLAVIAPSTAHQIELDLRDGEDLSGHYVLEPPGLLLHLWRPQAGLVTHLAMIGDFAGPYGFE
jgi:3',5'-cyclic-AMP phosphodiesterase